MDWTPIALGTSVVAMWKLAKCTLFAREFERETIDALLMRHGVNQDNLEVSIRVAREFRLRLVPVWLIATLINLAWLVFILKTQ